MNTEGVTNASCEFDVETLRPTFKLIVGAPGKSNAFAISQKLGLPDTILNRAESYVASDNKQMEKVLGELEIERQNAERERERTEKMRKEYERFKAESEAEIIKAKASAERALRSAQSKAEAMVESAKRSADYIMEEMDKLRKQKESERLAEELAAARKNVREHLRTNADVYSPITQEEQEAYVLPRPLKKGDEVIIMSLGKKAVVLDLPNKQDLVLIQAGIIKTKVRLSDLKLIEENEKKKGNSKSNTYRATVSHDFKPEIDLRGKTGEEAWNSIDKYFDEAQIAGFRSLRLIHGKGTGALKKYLWVELKRDPRVLSFRIGQFGEGDGGVTVVELK
jgi:DNA mismatch repair protein MutS2